MCPAEPEAGAGMRNRMRKKVEILSPAGSFESMRAAANAGCDAVYIGGSRFGARAFADNLDQDKMLEAIDFMHIRGKKLYLTVNTLLKESERSELYDYIAPFYKRGVDAVIVQDFGVLAFLHRNFPDLPLHASTQMTLTMSEGAELLKKYGVTRLVPARELTLAELIRMRKSTDLEIETFVHGALCYCYSGQCLMSSMLGGRSGNRGRCAQTCRMEYDAGGTRGYLLSPKDICTLAILPELIEAGIDSFKIEGRMKRSEYAAGVTAAYRKYADLREELGAEGFARYRKDHQDEWREDLRMLADLYNRGGFSEGYYKTEKGPAMMAMDRPNHSGVLVGTVESVRGIRAEIKLCAPIQAGDVLVIRGRDGSVDYEFTLGEGRASGRISTNFRAQAKVRPGLSVYRTKNEMLLKTLFGQYCDKDRKLEIAGLFEAEAGVPVRLTVSRAGVSAVKEGIVAQEAENLPVTDEKILAQLQKTGDTPFVFERLDIVQKGRLFLPLGKLNELRRDTLAELEKKLAEICEREESGTPDKSEKNVCSMGRQNTSADAWRPVSVSAVIQTKEQLEGVLKAGIGTVYLDMEGFAIRELEEAAHKITSAGSVCFVRFPHIFRSRTWDRMETVVGVLKKDVIEGVLVRSLEEIAFVRTHLSGKRIHTDYQLYAMNREAAGLLREIGAENYSTPVELNASELRMLDLKDATTVVYGRLPLMVSEQCVYKNTCGCKKGTADGRADRHSPGDRGYLYDRLYLCDRLGKKFPVAACCTDCYNTILNSVPLCLIDAAEEAAGLGISRVRLDFTIEGGKETEQIARAFTAAYEEGKTAALPLAEFTRGHFKRGVD